tara:strand:- start:7411 stop:8247 length:837 start_codon:yes stop_codon:yes gene_type:complete
MSEFLDFSSKGYLKKESFIVNELIINDVISEWEDLQSDPSEDLRDQKFINQPVVSVYIHKQGGKKKILPLNKLPSIIDILNSSNVKNLFNSLNVIDKKITLLETIIFNKPPKVSGDLHWHQDTSYFPLVPKFENNQWFLTLWLALDDVTKENGPMQYLEGSHNLGELASVDLNTGEKYRDDDDRPLISNLNFEDDKIFTGIVNKGDLLIHNGLTLHKSLSNTSLDRDRRALAFKFLIGDIIFKTRQGTSNFFQAERKFEENEEFKSNCYPAYAKDKFF